MKKDISGLLRPNISALTPYSTARDEFEGIAQVYLDANESAYSTGYNRYPDPRQRVLKEAIARAENVKVENLFLGNGSDEAIDILLRVFCSPGVHNAVAMRPSYGMYEVAAAINDVELRKVALEEDFSLDIEKLMATADRNTRLVFLCSPNNPTGKSIPAEDIIAIASSLDAIVVVDEAYIHYSPYKTMVSEIDRYNNIVVLRTLSKARGMAGLRVGMAIGDPFIIDVMSMVKYPYNLSQATINEALRFLDEDNQAKAERQIAETVAERERVAQSLAQLGLIKKVYPSDANFLLVKVDDPDGLYDYLAERSIIVRNRNRVAGCAGCLRITIGLPEENDRLVKTITNYEKETADN